MLYRRLIYSSIARAGLDDAEVMSIVRESIQHNPGVGITGLLCHGNGFFLQAIEGRAEAVNELYERIARDPRHTAPELHAYEGTRARSFFDWSMKLVGFEGAERSALLLRWGSPQFEPRRLTGDRAFEFLRELAESERRLAA